jgi:hypothetical protein
MGGCSQKAHRFSVRLRFSSELAVTCIERIPNDSVLASPTVQGCPQPVRQLKPARKGLYTPVVEWRFKFTKDKSRLGKMTSYLLIWQLWNSLNGFAFSVRTARLLV